MKFWLLFVFCVINLELAWCYKCDFENMIYYRYTCKIMPDSSSIEEKHLDGETDDEVIKVEFNGTVNDIAHLTQSDLTPICQRFKNLWWIDVRNVKSVDENLLQQCRNINGFHLVDSELAELPDKLFFEVPNLAFISLSKNMLTTLPENLFLNQKKLGALSLNKNQISCLPSNIFKSLTILELFDLDNNKIQSLNPKWFENLQWLTKLYLSYNEIQDLPINVFARLKNLRSLYLRYNQLTTIHSDSFGIHRNLHEIYLQNNKINTIDEKFYMLVSVTRLNMRGNICSNEHFRHSTTDEMKSKLSECFNNYQPRPNKKSIKCGSRLFSKQLIHGGTSLRRGEYPWNVALIHNTYGLFCGGSLVSNKHVVTAAHCMKGKYDSHEFGTGDFSVLLGVHNHTKLEEEGRNSSSVSSIHVHPHWNSEVQSFDADIAVLELASEVEFSNFIQPICMTNEDSEIVQTSSGIVVGFGRTESETISNIANKLEISIRNYHNCVNHSTDHHSFISARTFCGGPADSRGVCDGDSGSGVYVEHNGQFYIRGLVSSSLVNTKRECDVHKEAVFTDVTQYYDWISKETKMIFDNSTYV